MHGEMEGEGVGRAGQGRALFLHVGDLENGRRAYAGT